MSKVTAAMVKELRERTGAGMMECKKALVEADANVDEAIVILRKRGIAKVAKRAGNVAAEGVVIIKVAADQKSAFMIEINSETDFVSRDESFNAFANSVAEKGLELKANSVDALGVEDERQQLAHTLGENLQLRRVAYLESTGCVATYNHGSRIGVLVALDKANDALGKDIAMHVAALNPQAIDESNLDPDAIAKEREIFSEQARESGKPDNIIVKMVEGRVAKFIKETCLVGQPFVRDPDQTVGTLLKSDDATVTAFMRFEVGEGIEKEVVDFAEEVRAQVQGE
ncbi:MAG: elongation factor Ts [Coxiella sp. (in: Bacteria)]|nr:MAG: elongation factor Ts [Coxiella sp. (in: g-proteobacteria)]